MIQLAGIRILFPLGKPVFISLNLHHRSYGNRIVLFYLAHFITGNLFAGICADICLCFGIPVCESNIIVGNSHMFLGIKSPGDTDVLRLASRNTIPLYRIVL